MCPKHALYRLGGKHCILNDSSLCLTEAEANEGMWVGLKCGVSFCVCLGMLCTHISLIWAIAQAYKVEETINKDWHWIYMCLCNDSSYICCGVWLSATVTSSTNVDIDPSSKTMVRSPSRCRRSSRFGCGCSCGGLPRHNSCEVSVCVFGWKWMFHS